MGILFSFRVSPTLAKLPLLLVHLTSIFCFHIFNFITNVHICHRHQQILWFLPPFVTLIYFLLLTELFNNFSPLYPYRIISSLGAVQCISLSLEGLSIMLVTLSSVYNFGKINISCASFLCNFLHLCIGDIIFL